MKTVKFTSWQDGDFFIGFLNEYPDYQTQGLSKESQPVARPKGRGT